MHLSGARAAADSHGAPTLLVADTTPTAAQRKVAWGIVILLCVTFAALAPYLYVQLTIVPAFVPVVHAIVFITSLIAAAFLFSQFTVQPQPAFLALASGYLSAGLFAFFQSLAFPNAYSETGLFGGPNTAAWLFLLWRMALPTGILAYALIPRPPVPGIPKISVALTIAITTFCVVVGTCLLTWGVTIAEPYLPPLFTDATHKSAIAPFTPIPAAVLTLAAILMLLSRDITTLNLWLIVTLVAALPDTIMPGSRFVFGYYLGRSFELIASCAVLMALLTEASILYARLASAKALQKHEAAERFSSVEAATATLAHELRQPLNAIGIHAHAGAILIGTPKPDSWTILGEILNDIESDVRRASNVIDRVRGFVRRKEFSRDALDINEVVSNAIKLVSEDATARRVTVATELSGQVPLVAGDRTQITQVLLNVLENGMDVMEAVPAPRRRLTLQTSSRDGAVEVSVRDCGPGIAVENMMHLFEPFYTTRGGGMGLGLYISHSIVTAHGGRMWAENNDGEGATFCFSLPAYTHESAGAVENLDSPAPARQIEPISRPIQVSGRN